ncbi:hypothetical protein B296_00033272 [Ensete ventricosum]|uniref:Uncharacterized protein n=1 Tax=Ensete ventricosum TaxID=4639 RepID=A0A426ZQJ8_ENSVE|nr:hypothetical protein B296_00033272 [Ensete ventricosum]
MCLPTGMPMPERDRRAEAADRAATPLPPMMRDATPLNLPAILPRELLSVLRTGISFRSQRLANRGPSQGFIGSVSHVTRTDKGPRHFGSGTRHLPA